MKTLLAVSLFIACISALAGWIFVGHWHGAVGGASLAAGAVLSLVLLLGKDGG